MFAHQPADAAAQADTADTGVAHDAAGGREAVGLGLVIDITPQGATLHVGRALAGVDGYRAHRGEVDDDPVVAQRGAGHVVASARDRDLDIAVAREADGRRHIGGTGASGDQAGSAVNRVVPHGPGVVVLCVSDGDDLAPEPGDSPARLRVARPADTFAGRSRHLSSSTRDEPSRPPVDTTEKAAFWTLK